MRISKERTRNGWLAPCLAALVATASPALAINGPQPAVGDYRFDAVCGIGPSGPAGLAIANANFASGVLIAPDVVATTLHWASGWSTNGIQTSYSASDLFPNDNNPNTVNYTLAVRFRRQVDGTGMAAGVAKFDAALTNQQMAESYFHVGVEQVIYQDSGPPYRDVVVLLKLERPVTHIDPMPLYQGLCDDGSIVRSFSAGFGQTGPGAGYSSTRGHLRYNESDIRVLRDANGDFEVGLGRSTAVTESLKVVPETNIRSPADSGGGILIERSDGSMELLQTTSALEDGTFVAQLLHIANSSPPTLPAAGYRNALSAIATFTAHEGDLTSSIAPLDSDYGGPDATIDLLDVIYLQRELALGNIAELDRTTTGSFFGDPGYGVSDGVLDSFDEAYILNIIDNSEALDPHHPRKTPDWLDLVPDERFNAADVARAQDLVDTGLYASDPELLRFDLDADGFFDQDDVDLLDGLLPKINQGLVGDLTGDGVVDQADGVLLNQVISSVPDIFDGGYEYLDALYIQGLDADLDGRIRTYSTSEHPFFQETGDERRLRALLFGDVVNTSGFPIEAATELPDNVADDTDRDTLIAVWHAYRSLNTLDGTQIIAVGGDDRFDVAGTETTGGFEQLPDGQYGLDDLLSLLLRIGGDDSIRAGALDLNDDGRYNALDWIEARDSFYTINQGILTALPTPPIVGIEPEYFRTAFMDVTTDPVDFVRFDHGFLGDFDRNAGFQCGEPSNIFVDPPVMPCPDPTVPTHTDNCADKAALEAALLAATFAFDGRKVLEPGYMFEMDADLDGDNDGDDYLAVLQHYQPADVTTFATSNGIPDGIVENSDYTTFLSWWSTSDPRADITATGLCVDQREPDGVIDASDFSCFVDWYATRLCP
ncbi:MAG: GC-type dockerin domain-anchored protein [Planctomycetota bacterium]